MSNNNETPKTDTNNGNDGFVWSRNLTVVAGFAIAIAVAAARIAPALAATLEWVK
jgi:hypothetical protein